MRLRWLDGLRGVAALLVLVSHVGFWTGATADGFLGAVLARGDAGVAIFFALSAFLLARPWLQADLGGGTPPPLRTYAVRRAARLLPAYWLAYAAVLLVATWLRSRGTPPPGGVGDAPTILSHVFLLQGFTGNDYQGFSQTWSLTSELTFYVLLPSIAWFAIRSRARLARAWVALAGCAILFGMMATWAAAADNHAVLAMSAFGHAAWFAVGVLAAYGHVRGLIPRSPAVYFAGALALYLALLGDWAGPRQLIPAAPGEAVIKELGYAVFAGLMLLGALGLREREADSGTARVLSFLGQTSYGVFLWHVLVLQVLVALGVLTLFGHQLALALVLTLAISLVIAWLSWALLESRVIRWAHRGSDPTR